MLIVGIIILAIVGYTSWRLLKPPANNTGERGGSERSAPNTSAKGDFSKFAGKWMRSDGDYTLEIKSVSPDGKVDAAYFNPQSIHVGKANAFVDSGQEKIYVELQDVNYPGSAYTLIHDPGIDQLAGTYYQATEQQTYPVTFMRSR